MTTPSDEILSRYPLVQDRFPRSLTLADGQEIALSLMDHGDRDRVLTFAASIPADDLLYLRNDITDPAVIDAWLDRIKLRRTTTVVATSNSRVIGTASVTHSETNWTRHIGDIQVVVGPDGRGQGLGRHLAEEIFILAELFGLERLAARMTTDQIAATRVFESLGFEPVATLPGFVMDRDGAYRDLLVMAYDVRRRGAPAPENPEPAESAD
jgi:L-amino acid N-acyltransferase YncA